ncbi:MAG: hypothetical protein ACXWCG_12430 [Flavitalea sp.]
MEKELIIIAAALISLVIAFYAINSISRLHVSRRRKQVLYWISLVFPVLGLFLAWRSQKKV